MKNNGYMPYYGDDFERPMKAYRREVKWSYLAALWHYWSHFHCEGLPDKDDELQMICDCPSADWQRTKGVIFSGKPLFHLENGKWHQERARLEYREREEASQRRADASRIAVEARRAMGQIGQASDARTVSPSVQSINNRAELERVEKRIEDIRKAGTQVAGSPMVYSTAQKAELRTLKDRREELIKSLGFKA